MSTPASVAVENHVDQSPLTDQASSLSYPKLTANVDKRASIEQKHHSEFVDRASLLSTTSDFVDYRGLLNQTLVLLVISCGRHVLESLLHHGLQVRFSLLSSMVTLQPIAITFVLMFFIAVVYAIEIVAVGSSNAVSSTTFSQNDAGDIASKRQVPASGQTSIGKRVLRYVLLTLVYIMLLAHPVLQFRRAERINRPVYPHIASVVLTVHLTVLLKLVSFCSRDTSVPITPVALARALFYFIFAPTLCFQYQYPRNAQIRWSFVARRLIEFVFLSSLMVVIAEQWIIPMIDKDPVSVFEGDFRITHIIYKIFHLAIPNHVTWIIFFYSFFHSFLNLIAELMRFADREFYTDWWNASCPSEFWRRWNVPVHKFAIKHVYKPLVAITGNRPLSGYMVFALSALSHEYVASVALRVNCIYMAGALMVQPLIDHIMYPLVHRAGVEQKSMVRRKWIGNVCLWLACIFGQPITIMLYINDYRYHYNYSRNQSLVL